MICLLWLLSLKYLDETAAFDIWRTFKSMLSVHIIYYWIPNVSALSQCECTVPSALTKTNLTVILQTLQLCTALAVAVCRCAAAEPGNYGETGRSPVLAWLGFWLKQVVWYVIFISNPTFNFKSRPVLAKLDQLQSRNSVNSEFSSSPIYKVLKYQVT